MVMEITLLIMENHEKILELLNFCGNPEVNSSAVSDGTNVKTLIRLGGCLG